ncbi:MAG: hypothetical protein M0T84_13525 [Betaproteobacteria bacterium]|nr:hypothetical protein [Betaproteobacteria bacterium]
MDATKSTYRVYLRWPGSRVSEKTVTQSPLIAAAAFRELLAREDLRGSEAGLALTRDGKQVYYHRFEKEPDYGAIETQLAGVVSENEK